MAASYNPVPYQNWYANSGATNHITNDLQNLSVHSDYIGKDKVSVNNGQGLPISSIGSFVVHTKSRLFKLNHILHVPSISTNLLSIHQFDKYNNCIFFYASGFTIQDRLGKILFQGLTRNGLYPFPTACHSSSSSSHIALLGAKTS